MNPVLTCTELSKSYGRSGANALQGINLSLPRGKIIGLLGPNGSGKTTLIKLACGLLSPTSGEILINGSRPGVETKLHISYLPERNYLPNWMKIKDLLAYFQDFYPDFDMARAQDMIQRLHIDTNSPLKTMSKGTREKVQLILVMSRNADLYLLDEPIGGVDPAARDYILQTIITNYREDATVVISTHLISDVESVLDEVIFLNSGQISLLSSVEDIRAQQGKSIDALFREVYKC